MTTISGTYTVAVTLSPGAPHVAVSGTIDAYGAAGIYGQPVYAALFGAAGTDFNVHNQGLIESNGAGAADGGIVLGSGGTVLNGGSVVGGSGILIFGTGGMVRNTKLVEGSLGAGIALAGYGTVANTGIVSGRGAGIALGAGGYVDNGGNVFGDSGITVGGTASSYVYNTGNVLATTGDGVSLGVNGIVSNTGGLTAGSAGVVLAAGGYVYNYGVVQGGTAGVVLAAGGSVYNFKRIKGAYGVDVKSGLGYVYNYATARIAGQTIGVDLEAGGVVGNAGTIDGGTIGIVLAAGGIVDNSGSVVGENGAGILGQGAPMTITNSGQISSASDYLASAAVVLDAGGVLTNTGTIIGGEYAILLQNGGTIFNSGTVENFTYLRAGGLVSNSGDMGGVTLIASGTLINSGTLGNVTLQAGGTFENHGASGHMDAYGGATVLNYGYVKAYYILKGGLSSIKLKAGGLATNFGTIHAADAGIYANGNGTITNDGVIFGGLGLRLQSGGTAINAGMIDTATGIFVQGGGTVFDSGVIDTQHTAGSSTVIGTAIYFQSSYASTIFSNRLILSPEATLIGTVDVGRGVLELAASTVAGTITVSTNQVTDFGSLAIDQGAAWSFKGNTRLGAGIAVTNNGTITQRAGAHLGIAGALTGAGTISMGNKGLDLDGAVGAGQKIRFTGLHETLTLGDAGAFAGTIGGFTVGETIVLDGVAKRDLTEFAFGGGTLTVVAAGATIDLAFANAGSFGGGIFHDFKDGTGLGITLSGGAMAFLAPPASAAAGTLALPAYAPPARQSNAAPAMRATMSGWLDADFGASPTNIPPMVTLHGG